MRNLNYYNGYSTSTVVDTSMSLIQKVMWHPHSDQYLTLLFSHDDLWLHCVYILELQHKNILQKHVKLNMLLFVLVVIGIG